MNESVTMLIAQNDSSCNTEASRNNKVLITNNIVPSSLYYSLLLECDKSNTIAILSQLVFLYHLCINTDSHFVKKFNFVLYKVKYAVVRLEQHDPNSLKATRTLFKLLRDEMDELYPVTLALFKKE